MIRVPLLLRRLRRSVLAHRRLLAAVCAGLAVLTGLETVSPAPAPTSSVLVAARDVPSGEVLGTDDLTWAAFRPDSVPSGTLASSSQAIGRTVAAPLRRGEPLTDVRLVRGSLLDGYPGMVGAPVRVGDPGAVALLRVGDRVDVIAADPQGRSDAAVVAPAVAVVALPEATESTLTAGGLVVLAVREDTARALATAGVSRYLSVVIRH